MGPALGTTAQAVVSWCATPQIKTWLHLVEGLCSSVYWGAGVPRGHRPATVALLLADVRVQHATPPPHSLTLLDRTDDPPLNGGLPQRETLGARRGHGPCGGACVLARLRLGG